MKITSGNLKGRNITTPGGATHRMGERERLALFNMVGNNLVGVSVLDAEHLVPMKMKAWLDLTEKSAHGIHVNERDLRKHRRISPRS